MFDSKIENVPYNEVQGELTPLKSVQMTISFIECTDDTHKVHYVIKGECTNSRHQQVTCNYHMDVDYNFENTLNINFANIVGSLYKGFQNKVKECIENS